MTKHQFVMENRFTFKIESLLYGIENPKGAVKQVIFAQKVAKYEGMKFFNCLARLTFDNSTINRAFPNAVPTDETLLIGHQGARDTVLHLCIRAGQSTLRVATAYLQSNEVTIHSEYKNAMLLRKLSNVEISQIFSNIWDDIELIQPIPRHHSDD